MKRGEKNGPGSASRRSPTGHSPALARLFLVGLRPRRARLRFTGQNHYRTREEPADRQRRLHRPFLREEALADADASLSVPVDSAMLPSVVLIETASVCETVAAEYSVSGSQGLDRLPVSADGFTKGWIGVPPQRKERREQPRNKMTATTRFQNRFLNESQTIRKKPYRVLARTVRAKNRQQALDTQGSFRDGDTILVLTR
jgi:hypothetical protein